MASSSKRNLSPGSTTGPGGYDDGYRQCPQFWPLNVASALQTLAQVTELSGLRVLDLGCGEGTNAAWLAKRGCHVTAVEISESALQHAFNLWPDAEVNWVHGDTTQIELPIEHFHIVIAYGLLHCLPLDEVPRMVDKMQIATQAGGWNVLAVFNDRAQDLAGHPGFRPTLLPHDYYVGLYNRWSLEMATDQDLHETHPHNNIPHSHSITRIIAGKTQ